MLKLWLPILSIALIALLPMSCGTDFRLQFPQPGEPGEPGVAAGAVQIVIPSGATSLGPAAFGPNPAFIPPNTTVNWFNGDSVIHTVTSETGLWESGPIQPGGNFARAFYDPGIYPYFSKTEPSMRSAIEVSGGSGTPRPTTTVGPSPLPTPAPTTISNPSPVPFPTYT